MNRSGQDEPYGGSSIDMHACFYAAAVAALVFSWQYLLFKLTA